MLWCTKIYIIYLRSSPRSCIPYACTVPWSDHRQSHMPRFYQWVISPPSVWVSGCVLRPMRWVWGSWWQLLCCHPSVTWGLLTGGSCDLRPWSLNLTCGVCRITSGEAGLRSKTDCWTELDKQPNDRQSESRWMAAVEGVDEDYSLLNLCDDRDQYFHCCCLLNKVI